MTSLPFSFGFGGDDIDESDPEGISVDEAELGKGEAMQGKEGHILYEAKAYMLDDLVCSLSHLIFPPFPFLFKTSSSCQNAASILFGFLDFSEWFSVPPLSIETQMGRVEWDWI